MRNLKNVLVVLLASLLVVTMFVACSEPKPEPKPEPAPEEPKAFYIDIAESCPNGFATGGTYVSVVIGEDQLKDKIITTKDRFALEGNNNPISLIIDGFLANNADAEGHNEHQWGYKVEKAGDTILKITPLTVEKNVADDAQWYLVGLGGHGADENPHKFNIKRTL